MNGDKMMVVELSENDLGQLREGVEARIAAWETTAAHLNGDTVMDGCIEECSDAEEAEQVAAHYRSILAQLNNAKEKR